MGISDIRLYTDELYIHVEVKAAGTWFEVIRERKDSSSIDHFVTADAIAAAEEAARQRRKKAGKP